MFPQQVAAALDAVGAGVAAYGDDGRFAYVNPAYADLLGTDRETLRGTPIWAINPAFDADRFGDYWDSFDEGQSRVADATHVYGDTRIEVSVRTTCTTFEGRRYHVGTIVDRGREETLDAEVAYQASVLEAIKEATIDGLLLVDEDADIVSYNRRFAELWDLPESLLEAGNDEPVLERVVAQVAEPEQFRERVASLYDHPEEDARDLIELRDGRTIDRYTTAVWVDGTYEGRLWVFRDITERVERQRRLERQNRRLEEFATLVSHDLRNPLGVAQGRIEQVAEECDSEHVTAVERSLDRMEALVDDMLALARQGRAIGDRRRVVLADVARRAWEAVDAPRATLAVETGATLGADPDRLCQALENLFRNAVEHAGPEVTVTVSALPDGRGFAVEDDGPGLDPDLGEDVFELGVTSAPDGTGFGLGIVEEVVSAHGWEVGVTEGTDGGARFEVTGVDLREGGD
ncbi:MAG: PAS domain-containing sensor histidine kinase [Halobacteriaceae archaeon]